MRTLDRQKNYGSIVGDEEGRAYEQNGVYFDAHGNEVVAKGSKPAPVSKPAEVKPVVQVATSNVAVADQVGKQ